MDRNRILAATGVAAGGLAFFVGAVAFIIGLAQWNARITPAVPWFPVPVLAGLLVTALWLQRRWDIGLRLPRGRFTGGQWAAVAAFAVSSMLASHAVLVLEGAAHGITRSFEAPPPGVTPFFAVVYWLVVVVAMSTASEVAFRGLIQSRLTVLWGTGIAIAVATFVNTIAHRWDGLAERTFGVIAILLAWSALRHVSGSLVVTILTHIGAIMTWELLLLRYGPWDHAAMDRGDLALTAAVGLVALALSVWLGLSLQRALPRPAASR